MRYSDGYLRDVVPPTDPPSGEVPLAVVAELERLADDLSSSDGPTETYRRSARWTYAVIEQYRLSNYIWEQFHDLSPWQLFGGEARLLPPIQFGLFDPDYEVPGFGVIVATPPSQFQTGPGRIGTIRFPRLERTFVLITRMMLTTPRAGAAGKREQRLLGSRQCVSLDMGLSHIRSRRERTCSGRSRAFGRRPFRNTGDM